VSALNLGRKCGCAPTCRIKITKEIPLAKQSKPPYLKGNLKRVSRRPFLPPEAEMAKARAGSCAEESASPPGKSFQILKNVVFFS
jgi:hypothetical protein